MYSFPNLEQFYSSLSSSNPCFLICIQISQEAGQVICYSHLFKNFPQFIVFHRVKGFGIVNKAEVDVFWMTQQMLAIWSLVPLPFLKPAWTSGSSQLKPGLEIFEHYLTGVWDEWNCVVVWAFFGIAFLWDWNENTFSSPVATAEFSKLAGILSAALSQHHLSRSGIAQLEFHHLH